MNWKKISSGILVVIFALGVAMVNVSTANAFNLLESGQNNLGTLFTLDKLFNSSQGNGILSKDKTNLGDLFVLNQLFTDNTETKTETITSVTPPPTVAQRVSGKIVIQTEEDGEAWYVYPITNRRVFLGRPSSAYAVMSDLSLGVNNEDYNKIANGNVPANVVGRFILKVEDKGRLFYVNPSDKKIVSVANAIEAQNLITKYGLGISENDINKITVGYSSVAVAN